MGLSIVIAEPREDACLRLKVRISKIPRVDHVYDANTLMALHKLLLSHFLDLILVHKSILSDFTVVTNKPFILLADKFEMEMLQAVCKHGGVGYFLDTSSIELFEFAVSYIAKMRAKIFILDPVIAPLLIQGVAQEESFTTPICLDKLTSREREVLYLLVEGLEDMEIAEHLCISQVIVRSHVLHILRKLHITREQLKYLRLPERKK
jgi:DNA-binding NarL/FixJ family response regulator